MSEPNFVMAEAKSFKLLQRFGIETPDFDLEDLAYAMGIEIKIGGVSSGDARIFRNQEGKGILRLNAEITDERRKRFSIAHELGHWEMHPDIKQGYVCTAEHLRDYANSAEEAEANWFAATLLMPKFLIAPETFRLDPSFNHVRRLANEFKTSITAAARRFVELSKQPVTLVASSGGIVQWCAMSHEAKYYFVAPRALLPRDSLTAKVAAEEKPGVFDEIMSPLAWFPSFRFSSSAELHESAWKFPNYDYTLTLLWMPK